MDTFTLALIALIFLIWIAGMTALVINSCKPIHVRDVSQILPHGWHDEGVTVDCD